MVEGGWAQEPDVPPRVYDEVEGGFALGTGVGITRGDVVSESGRGRSEEAEQVREGA